MKQNVTKASLIVTFLLAVAYPLTAGDPPAVAPAWHVGTFAKNYSPAICIGFAKGALAHENLKILHQDGKAILAGNANVLVEVACFSQNAGTTWIRVSAFSTNSATAELARHTVREIIVKTVRID
jgi:hypothetical protein